MKKSRLIPFIIVALTLNACSTFMDKDNTPEPAQLVHFKPEADLTSKWYVNAGSGSDSEYLKLTPAIEKGVIFTTSKNGTITALNQSTGQIIWQNNTNAPLSSGVSVYRDTLFVGTQNAKVLAVSASNGRTQWQAAVSSEVLSPIAAKNDIALVKTIDGHVSALSTSNGHRLWRYSQTPPDLILRGGSAPQIHQNSAVVGFATGKLAKLSLQEGSLLWVEPIASPQGNFSIQRMVDIDADPIIVNNRVYAATYQGNIAALDLQDGKPYWSHRISSYSGIAADNQRVYVSDAEGHVWAFDADSGSVLWRQQGLTARNITGPVVFGPYIAVGDAEGYIHLMSKQDGHFVARTFVNSAGILATPLVKNNVLFVYTKNGYLAAYTLR